MQQTISGMKKHGLTNEHKQAEADFVRSLMDVRGVSQKELAELIGKKQTDISQWFSGKTLTAIPDYFWIKLAVILEFDPAKTRPWLREMWVDMGRIWGGLPKSAEDAFAMVNMAASKLTKAELLKLAGRLEAYADEYRRPPG